MASIKAIEQNSVHRIQSGQVIVDLCSVVKELVENSLDAHASSIDVRFKNSGLDAIEVQDNGDGISPQDFENVALKHYTSKLASYEDLDSLKSFGFRGEALSSLCALSKFQVITARASDAPKGTRLDFEQSGDLKGTTLTASQKGTTVVVESLFYNLPVRKKELEKMIKREYAKVLSLLHAYACISTNIKFSVSNQANNGKKIIAFSTKSNATVRENIANVYGARTLMALISMDLTLQMEVHVQSRLQQSASSVRSEDDARKVQIKGFISRPVLGEGRQAPDRQMFFVNSRPCNLPQVAKAINEVYKSFNITQSPFVFADFKLDTNAYDVNVSPDKRTILLHDQANLLDELKEHLGTLFAEHGQSVPQAHVKSSKIPPPRPLAVPTLYAPTRLTPLAKDNTTDDPVANPLKGSQSDDDSSTSEEESLFVNSPTNVLLDFATRNTEDRRLPSARPQRVQPDSAKESAQPLSAFKSAAVLHAEQSTTTRDNVRDLDMSDGTTIVHNQGRVRKPVDDFHKIIGFQRPSPQSPSPPPSNLAAVEEDPIPALAPLPSSEGPGVVKNAFDHMRPRRMPADTAIITINGKTSYAELGSAVAKQRHTTGAASGRASHKGQLSNPSFHGTLTRFLESSTAPRQTSQGESDGGDSSERLFETVRASSRVVQNKAHLSRDEAGVLLDAVDTPFLNSSGEPMDDDGMNSDDHNDDNDSDFDLDEEDKDNVEDNNVDDDDYVDEAEKRLQEEARVAKLIAHAEEQAAKPTLDNVKRATTAMSGRQRKESTLRLALDITTSIIDIELKSTRHTTPGTFEAGGLGKNQKTHSQSKEPVEEQLVLTVSKQDFANMRIIGQFNLGFILAVRGDLADGIDNADELFIIDQHASDEKYNFERLQSETIVQNQRLVQAKTLELTAVEEEIILNQSAALIKNGFIIETDESGDAPTGRRCRLISLPMSREVVFNLRDLEELLALLAEKVGSEIPRPSKVRRMFAMRACRGSIMVGKTLTHSQMEKVVRHMGEIDKPWNCPHGRPTMRHVFGLGGWSSWQEGNGLVDDESQRPYQSIWDGYVNSTPVSSG